MKNLHTFISGLAILATITISVVTGIAEVKAQTEGEEARMEDEAITQKAKEVPKDKKLLTTSDIADDAVTSPKIKNGEVNTDDLANDAVTSSKIANGAVTLEHRQVTKEFNCCSPGSSSTIHATCADDEVVTGGGYEAAGGPGGSHAVIFSGQQASFPKDWVVTMQGGAEDEPSSVYAECLKIVP